MNEFFLERKSRKSTMYNVQCTMYKLAFRHLDLHAGSDARFISDVVELFQLFYADAIVLSRDAEKRVALLHSIEIVILLCRRNCR